AALRAVGPLHLACPVRLRRDNPAASGWRLGDGSLARPADLAQLSAATALVWLDADTDCATGHGPGDARLALPLALQRAGVAEVIDSLWPLPAAATAALQAAFAAARQANAGCTATALQQARAAVRARHPHPAIWAAPCLIGGQPAQRL
ncbi:MAG: CHAT domain-containing protein, partial [Aquabacterium sp.]|nr:CHAT domain-containing protein [Aquabacterium sp.]